MPPEVLYALALTVLIVAVSVTVIWAISTWIVYLADRAALRVHDAGPLCDLCGGPLASPSDVRHERCLLCRSEAW